MPLSFPSSPTTGQQSTQNGRTYSWTGYAWELVASSGGGSGEDSLLRSLFVPPAPTSVSASAGNAQAVVSWTAPTGVIAQAPITDYVVQFKQGSGAWETFTDSVSTATSATVTGLTNGTAYTFKVAATNAVGTGSYSTASSAVTPSSAVFRPIPVLTSDTSDGVAYANTLGGGQVWRLFDDGNPAGEYYSNRNQLPAGGSSFRYFQYTFANNLDSLISGYRFTAIGGYGYYPAGWTLSGSNDGINFTDIDTRSGMDTGTFNYTVNTYTLASAAQYRTFRWTLTDGGDPFAGLSQVQLLQ